MPIRKTPDGLQLQCLAAITRNLDYWREKPEVFQELPLHMFSDLLQQSISHGIRDKVCDNTDIFELFAGPKVLKVNTVFWTDSRISLSDVLTRCSNLEELLLKGQRAAHVDLDAAFAHDLSKLTRLYVSCCNGIRDQHLLTLIERCPALQELEITICDKISTAGMMNLVHMNKEGKWTGACLRKLYLLGTKVTVKGVTHVLKHAPKLVHVEHKQIVKAVSNLGHQTLALEHLRIDLNPLFNPTCLRECLDSCPDLRILVIFTNDWSRPDVYQCFGYLSQPKITHITFGRACSFSEDVMAIMKHIGSTLTHIDLEAVHDFTLVPLGESCPNLESLTVHIVSWSNYGGHYNDKGTLFQKLQDVNLMQIQTEEEDKLSDTMYLNVLLKNCQQLHTLDLHDFNIINDVFIQELIVHNRFRYLKAVSFSGTDFTSDGIWRLVEHCPVLKEVSLDVETCPHISAECINYMVDRANSSNWDIKFAADMDSFIVLDPRYH